MADDTIEIDAEREMFSVRVRNLVDKSVRKGQDLLEFDALMFNLDIALPVAGKKGAKPTDERALKKTLASVANKAEFIIDQMKKKCEAEIEKLIKDIDSQYEKDQKGDANAYKNANTTIKNTVKRVDDLVDGAPATIRKMLEKELKGDQHYDFSKLNSVGTWGFRTSKGIWLRSGKFQSISDDDNEANDLLAKNIVAAKSAASTSSPFEFILASGRDAGLVIRKRTTGADKADAVARREGSGAIYYGTILYERTKYMFVLDKDCSVGTGAKLAKMIQQALEDATGKRIALRVVGEGYGDEEEGDEEK